MNKKNINARNIVLLILFVMIIICSVISISYSYYATTASTTLFIYTDTDVDCLNITSASGAEQYNPFQLFPKTNSSVSQNITSSEINPQTSEYYFYISSFTDIGTIKFSIQNNCLNDVNYDIVFVPDSLNNISLDNIGFFSCEDDCNPSIAQYYNLTDKCYTTSSAPTGFWTYMGNTYSLGGSDQRMCSVVHGSSYPSIQASAVENFKLAYWLKDDATNYSGKRLSGKFIIYTTPNVTPEYSPGGGGNSNLSDYTGTIYRNSDDLIWNGQNIGSQSATVYCYDDDDGYDECDEDGIYYLNSSDCSAVASSRPTGHCYSKTETIGLISGYETSTSNISSHAYLKHIVENGVVTASYACVISPSYGVLNEYCFKGGSSSYYGSYDGMTSTRVSSISNPTANSNLYTLSSMCGFYTNMGGTCSYSNSYSYAQGYFDVDAYIDNDGRANTNDEHGADCTVHELGYSICH